MDLSHFDWKNEKAILHVQDHRISKGTSYYVVFVHYPTNTKDSALLSHFHPSLKEAFKLGPRAFQKREREEQICQNRWNL